MATQTTGLGGLTPEMKTYYDKKLLSRLLPNQTWMQFGQKRPIPKGGGKTIEFRKFTALAAATTALTEGVTPSGNSLSVTNQTASLSQYGDYIEISDLLDLTAIDPVLDETAALLGEQAALSLDTIVRDILTAGTTVQYANGRASRATVAAGDNLTVAEIRKAVRTLKRNNVKPVAGQDYVAIVEPGATYDLQSDTKWEEYNKYVNPENMYNGEIGRLFGVRFVESTNHKKFAGAGAAGVDVYCTIILGQNAYGTIDVAGSGSVQNIFKPHGGGQDPLNQRATSAWKAFFTASILEQLAVLRIEHTVSG